MAVLRKNAGWRKPNLGLRFSHRPARCRELSEVAQSFDLLKLCGSSSEKATDSLTVAAATESKATAASWNGTSRRAAPASAALQVLTLASRANRYGYFSADKRQKRFRAGKTHAKCFS